MPRADLPEALLDASEQAASRWSRGKLMPKHRPDRPSQLSEGRRVRYLRLTAEREGISLAEAECRHPARTRKAVAS